jgi:hypothetical protein
MRLSRLHDQVFVTYILHVFSEGNVSGPAADILSIFTFSPHVLKQVEGKCSHCSFYAPSKFQQSGSQCWHVHGILDVHPKGKIEENKVR